MTLASATNENNYIGSGSADSYSYSFLIYLNTDLVVTQRDTADVETELTIDVDYTVTGAGDADGGTVELLGGDLPLDYALQIKRERPLTQDTNIRNFGDYFANTHEDVFDKLVMLAQQLKRDIDRAMLLATTVTGVSAVLPVPEALKWMRWDSNGTALENISAGDLSALTTVDASLSFIAGNLEVANPLKTCLAGGSADAITCTTSPTFAALSNHISVHCEAASANATTTPTFAPDGLAAKTIVKGSGDPLVPGDIPGSGFMMLLSYDISLDAWVLMNPFTDVGKSYMVTKTGSYTPTISDIVLLGNSTGGTVTFNLPAVAGTDMLHKIYVIKKIHASNTVVINPNASETIDTQLTITLRAINEYVVIQNNGSAWYIIGGNFNYNGQVMESGSLIRDLAGTTLVDLASVASAVNYLQVLNSITTEAVQLLALGSDTNIDMLLTPKGSGIVRSAAAARFATLEVTTALAGSTPTAHMMYEDIVPKGWLNLNGSAAPANISGNGFNVSSVTDNGVGDYTITWDVDFANTDYACVCTGNNNYANISHVSKAVGTTRIRSVRDVGSSSVDQPIGVLAFGEQA